MDNKGWKVTTTSSYEQLAKNMLTTNVKIDIEITYLF